MAGPSTAKPSVGSVSWIANERSTVQQLGDQDMEDFAFAARNDLEWLNEHMAEIFERNNLDVAELLKTPGKLRGQKTPRTGRKQVRPVAPGREPANENPSDNPFYTVAPLPGKRQTSPSRGSSKSPSRSLRVLQDIKVKKPTNPIKDNSVGLKQPESQPSLTDSGVWSDFQSQPQQTGLVSEYNSFVSEPAIDSRAGDRSSSYHIAPEEPDEREQEDEEQEQEDGEPVEEVVEVEPEKPEDNDLEPPKPESPGHTIKVASPGIIALEKTVSSEGSPVKLVSLLKKAANKSEPEPRRSGRLARRSSPPPATVEAQPDRLNSSLPPSSPNIPQQGTLVEISEKISTLPIEQSPIPPLAAAEPARPQTPSPEKTAESAKNSPAAPQTPGDEDSPRSSSSSESPAPEIPMARKSILNFASLPAREPLTNKKKSLGVKHTRDSNVEQVRLNGTSRASWMNRKGNGKSLGASSRQIERIEKADKEAEEVGMKDAEEEEIILKPDASNNLKRKTETVRDGSRKKSKGTSEESELEGDESDGETAKAVALHNKTSTQRLHDKIQQLGKVNASREARSFPSSGSGVAYPELPQLEKEPVQAVPASKSAESEEGQPSVAAIDQTSVTQDDEEWIPMPKQTLTRSQSQKEEVAAKEQTLARSQSHTEGTVASKQQETEKPVSARWRHHSPQNTSPQPTIRTITTSESAPNLRSPAAVRQLPLSPLKASFSEDWIKSPASPTAKPSGEGAITAVKAHTSVVFKKAKEMLLKSSTASTSAKIETMNPASRGWQGGQNSREQLKSVDSQKSAKPMEQLYPDLGIMMAKDMDSPSSTKTPVTETLKETRQMSIDVPEAVVEPNREPRRTRSSASKDTPENSPEVEQTAVKIQKARAERESERLEREERLREKEEQLRRVEEELRREREERELEHRQQEEKLRKQREESLRLAEEKLRKEQELQQKHKEEQIRREKEEFKKLQEEKLKQEKEELRRRQQEELRKQKEEAQKAKEVPASFHDQDDSTDKEEDEDNEDDNASEADTRTMIRSSAEPERPPSRLQKAGTIRFQKTRDTKPVQRPGSAMKDHAKSKGPPVSISVGTASQREMQNQRNKPQAPSTSTLVAALKQSFENPSLMTSTSQTSLNSSTSNNSLRSSNLGGPSKPLKSLAAAASQLKKEQEDKERKLVAKREIERRKLENQRKMDDEARRARQKPVSTQKTLARTPAVANLRQTSEEPERRLDFKTGAKPGLAKTAVKRAFQPDAAEEQQQYRQTATKSGAPSYQQDPAKKRRTGEYDERGERTYEMAPPIRQSVAKKSAMPHGYTQASASGMPSMLRPPTKHGVPMPQVESVKFSKEKIRFAGESSTASASTTPSTFKTPGSKSAKPSKTPAGAKDSPIYQNGELIDLPDIQTDSDDDDDDYPAKSDFHVPKWAESPELRGLLENQQSINPEDVFGPMARLDMDAIFRDGGGRQKFRARTSSANWSGADRLTPDEIAADMEARRKMIEQGGWKFQPPQ
ncbi:hypothetical protein P167DRAFT_236595 [Morchella conica CCBAS932]|uniref:Inner centromere protein ARK-binding domain-containing protein n=1 Tax=Morchella conica CCBAS932 TaxID=1392247 RepID=A0A3N4KJZ4_9PEZI|nr:hypothetical protein P167DRAFT_236595 [Morchella conica CCBAS932]